MSLVAAGRIHLHPGHAPRRLIAVAVMLSAAAAAVVLRWQATLPIPSFVGACQRLRASGLPITSRDWFCQPAPFATRVASASALLLMAVGLVLPCVILAATGLRWSSLLPLAVAPWLTLPGIYAGISWWGVGSGTRSGIATDTFNTLVLAGPVIAIWFVVPPHERHQRRPRLAAALVAGVACAAASGLAGAVAARLLAEHWASMGGGVESTPLGPAMFSIGLFGLLLGTDRRWWPWSLAPVALLLSAAPSAAIIRSPEGLMDWSQFAIVVPVAFAGLAWSLWRPMSTWLSLRLDPAREVEAIVPDRPRSRLSTLVLNAGAIGLLACSVILFRGDPLPAQIGVALPTYLGERIQALDVRTKLDLRQAIAAMDDYAASTGTYRGFDAVAGRTGDPSLAWSDGDVASDGTSHVRALTMAVEGATVQTARVAALSPSGAAFCIERTGTGAIRYGSSGLGTANRSAAFSRAIAACTSTPWSGAAVRMLKTETLCEGVDRSSYLICRMVQVLISNTMRQTKPV